MTENDGGTPRDPERDPETPPTPPTQPVPDSSFGGEQAPAGPADPGQNMPSEPPAGAHSAAAPAGAHAAPGPHGAPAPQGQPGAQWAQHPASPPKNDLGVWALVTGILSYVFCPLVLGIVAIIVGTMSRRAADQGLANNRGMGTAGLILGWVNVALAVLVIVFFVIALAAGLLSGGFGQWGDMNRYSY
jgi:hypothetical protein